MSNWVNIMGKKGKAVVDSGVQITVINRDSFKECMKGKQSRPVQLKNVAEDNSLTAEVIDVEIEMGGISKKNEFLWLIFLMNVSLRWIQLKCFK